MALSTEQLRRLSVLLEEMLACPPTRRSDWINAQREEALRPHLERMRRMHDGVSTADFLMLPAIDFDDTQACVGLAAPEGSAAVGPFRLLRQIGRGGMGIVWLAERSDGLPARQVALKMPRLASHAGLAARMARERDLCARLSHPAIATLYDAGMDASGRPYLAFEYIQGIPMDEWSRTQSVPRRLQVFLQVVEAVSHAHARLVLHRDIKPSNVLVDSAGRPHLLDFGIAKLIEGSFDANDRLTLEHGRALSPGYASPEHCSGRTLSVASDVYSLGMLLHVILVGHLPPVPLNDSTPGEFAPASTHAPGPAVATRLRGDLDAIIAKSIRRDPKDRYASADALAGDVQNFLAGRPVVARPASRWYRARKLIARRKWACCAGLASVALVAGAGTVATFQTRRAVVDAQRAREVKDFVVGIFNANRRDPGSVMHDLPLGLLLEKRAAEMDREFAANPLTQSEIHGVVADIYSELQQDDAALFHRGRQLNLLRATPPSGQVRAEVIQALEERVRAACAKRAESAKHPASAGRVSLPMAPQPSRPVDTAAAMDPCERSSTGQ